MLETIMVAKQKEIEDLHTRTTRDHLERIIEAIDPPLDVLSLMDRAGRNVIAEVKRASPSRGAIKEGLDPSATAVQYAEGGAGMISVLTDAEFFHGAQEDMRAVRKTVDVPILRKDFIIDQLQVWESRSLGADTILLIVRLLTDAQLREFRETAEGLHMQVLMETHSQAEIARAIDAGATMIGVNNRDLDTFSVSRTTSLELQSQIPSELFSVSESGILEPAHARELFTAGYDAVLIGEALVRAEDKQEFIQRCRAI